MKTHSLTIVCSGYLVRHPVGGHTWHHLQYLVGLKRLGHHVIYFEDFGWPNSCYVPGPGECTSDPAFGLRYLVEALRPHGLHESWCYLAEDGSAHGMSRERLEAYCRACDLYLNLSNINWIPELEQCRRRVLVDTDPVFTQIGAHGSGGPFSRYDVLFTYGERVHASDCTMPTAGQKWRPTRQPIVLDLWNATIGDSTAPLSTIVNWSAYGSREHQGKHYGQKDVQFQPFLDLPRETQELMEIALAAPDSEPYERFRKGGWRLRDPLAVTRTPWTYQDYLRASRGEFCVAKHAYVITRCGWFSDRTAGYLASGRPAIVEDTGFSEFLPCGKGLLPFTTREQAHHAIAALRHEYALHCRCARQLAEEHFDSDHVLGDLIEQSFARGHGRAS